MAAAFSLVVAGNALFTTAGFAQAPGGAAPPPPGVTVQTVKPITLPVTYEYAGRVVASREVEVRARVGGILLQRAFDEGSRVNQGDLLFKIDPATYQAQVALARANVLEAQANLSQAQRTEERSRTLAQRGASSQATLDDAVSARELAEAQVEAAKAQLQTANLSLDYATVQAPVGGITSLEQVPEGSLLSTGDLLTRITQLDPINVNFSAADTEAASIRQLLENGTLQGAKGPSDLKVTIAFGDGSTYDKTGTIDFTSTTIDTSTGTILSRAVLPNPDSRLLPGQFVRLKLEGLSVQNAITLPTEALMQGPQGTFVYTLDDKNVASVTPVNVGRQLENSILVSQGLKGGERIVVKGVVKVRPGAAVDPVATLDPEAAGGQTADDADTPAGAEAAPSSDAGENKGAPQKAGDDNASAADADTKAAARPQEKQRFTAFADTGTDVDEPPVPRSALPNGTDARNATQGITERAELN